MVDLGMCDFVCNSMWNDPPGHAGDAGVISLDSEEEEDDFITFLRDLDMKRDHRRKRPRPSAPTHPSPIPTRDAVPSSSAGPLGQPSNLNQPTRDQNLPPHTARASLYATNRPSEGHGVEQAGHLFHQSPNLYLSDMVIPGLSDMLMPALPPGDPASPQLEMFSPPKPKRQRHAEPHGPLGGDSAIPVLASSSLQDEVDKMSASDAARMFREGAAQRRAGKAGFRPRDSGSSNSIHASDAELVIVPPGFKAPGRGPSKGIHASDAELVNVPFARMNTSGHGITGRHAKPVEQAAAKSPLFKHVPNRVWEGVKKANLTGRTFSNSGAQQSQASAHGNDNRADDMAAGALPDSYGKPNQRAWAQQPKRMRATSALSRRLPVLNGDGSLPGRAPELDSDDELELDGVEVVDTASPAASRQAPAGIMQSVQETTEPSLVNALARRRAAHGRMLTSAPKAKGPQADLSTNRTEAQLVASQDALTQKAEAIDLTMDLAQVRSWPEVALQSPLTPAVECSRGWSRKPLHTCSWAMAQGIRTHCG